MIQMLNCMYCCSNFAMQLICTDGAEVHHAFEVQMLGRTLRANDLLDLLLANKEELVD